MQEVDKKPSVSEEILKNKETAMSLEHSKRKYIKEMVFQHGPLWWDNLKRDLSNPEDKESYRSAMIEFNKLQARVLPTEITGADGEQIVLNVVQWAKADLVDPPKIIDGEAQNEN